MDAKELKYEITESVVELQQDCNSWDQLTGMLYKQGLRLGVDNTYVANLGPEDKHDYIEWRIDANVHVGKILITKIRHKRKLREEKAP